MLLLFLIVTLTTILFGWWYMWLHHAYHVQARSASNNHKKDVRLELSPSSTEVSIKKPHLGDPAPAAVATTAPHGAAVAGDTLSPVVSVNYHFTRQCNYQCGFCFHTAKSSHVEGVDRAKKGITLLVKEGMRKINFSGGEPFTSPKFLGEMVQYCKEELALESVSIVSNGSKIRERWMKKFGKYIDILAISCDSFREETNVRIGRGNGRHLEQLKRVREWCRPEGVLFKINTVVNTYNWQEDMTTHLKELDPIRWKVFQCLLVGGENAGPASIRNASTFVVNSDQFASFLEKHKADDRIAKVIVPEDNEHMQASYLILDEYMRFLDCSKGAKTPSQSILDVGVNDALRESGFDIEMFRERGGVYEWTRDGHAAAASAAAVDALTSGSMYDW